MPDSAYRAAVLTVSDLGARGEREDTAGPAAVSLLRGLGFEVAVTAVIPDGAEGVAARLREWCDAGEVDLVVTSGGTGLTPRDQTPEATLAVIQRRVPGMEEAMRAASLAIVPTAMLSRGVCGVRGRTLIVNLPGSERAVREHLAVILPVLPHACAQLRSESASVAAVHETLRSALPETHASSESA